MLRTVLVLKYTLSQHLKQHLSRPVVGQEKSIQLTVTMPKDFVREVDKARGDIPRSLWLRQLALAEIERKRKKKNKEAVELAQVTSPQASSSAQTATQS